MSIKLPPLTVIRQKTGGTTAFSGLNHNLRIKDSEFFAMQNMSSSLLPVMSSREKRRKLRNLNSPNGIAAHEKLCFVDGGDFYYDGEIKGQVTDGPKQFVRMGAFLLIWPDKMYYNTHTDEWGSLEGNYTSTGEVTANLCRIDGQLYGEYVVQDTEPENPENNALWVDTSSSPNVLRQYFDSTGIWTAIPTVYTRIEAEGIGTSFKQHDGVTLSGFERDDLNGKFYLVDRGDDYIIVVALITEPLTQTGEVTVAREIPDMDYLVEHDNRIWGCSTERHEIYASTLGDPTNWNQFMGLATDSYAVTVGSTGVFTGAASHLGMVLFFKEDCIHQIMGTKPANFQLDTTNCRGVAQGSEKSLCRVNETLFYMSRDGVCMFNSALPSQISDALGKESYKNGIAGAKGSCYYISLEDMQGDRHLFVYDAKLGVWIREDSVQPLMFASLDSDLLMLTEDGDIWSLTGQSTYDGPDAEEEASVPWMLETGEIGLDTPTNQYVSNIQLHMEGEAGVPFRVWIQYNSDMRWKEIFVYTPTNRRSVVIPVIPARARNIRLKLTGEGHFRLYAMTMKIETGSDVYGT